MSAASLRPDPRARGECLIDRYAALALEQGALDLVAATDEGPPPPALLAALARALAAHTSCYPDFAGEPALRAAVAARRARHDGLATDASEVVITIGATGALAAAFAVLLAPGDELVTFTPGYALPLGAALAAGARVRAARLRPEPSRAPGAPAWTFDARELAALFGARTRAVLLTSPHSPTGKVFRAQELELLVDLCRAHGAFLVHDAVYEDFELGTPACSPRALYPEGTIVAASASKALRAPGLRVGWATGPRDVVARMARVQEESTAGASRPAQVALAEVLAASEAAGTAGDALLERHARVRRALERCGLECLPAEGGLCFVARVRDGTRGDVELAQVLLARGIASVPLAEFEPEARAAPAAVRVGFGRGAATLARLEERCEAWSRATGVATRAAR